MHVHCICGIVVFTFLHNYEIVYSVVANYACIRLFLKIGSVCWITGLNFD